MVQSADRVWPVDVRLYGAQSDLLVVDLLVLLMLYASPPVRKRVDAILRKKVVSGLLPRQLLATAIRTHAPALQEYDGLCKEMGAERVVFTTPGICTSCMV